MLTSSQDGETLAQESHQYHTPFSRRLQHNEPKLSGTIANAQEHKPQASESKVSINDFRRNIRPTTCTSRRPQVITASRRIGSLHPSDQIQKEYINSCIGLFSIMPKPITGRARTHKIKILNGKMFNVSTKVPLGPALCRRNVIPTSSMLKFRVEQGKDPSSEVRVEITQEDAKSQNIRVSNQ